MVLSIGVLGSTRGTDLEGVIDGIEDGSLKGVEIVQVLCNKEGAGILEMAERHGIPSLYLNPRNDDGKRISKEDYDGQMSRILKEKGVELILLIGYNKFISEGFIKEWENRVMNIHPSLLPAFAGAFDLNIHEAVLERGCKLSGATLMFIDAGPDTGPIISQGVVTVQDDDSPDSLKAKVQAMEVELILQEIQDFRDGRLRVEGSSVFKRSI